MAAFALLLCATAGKSHAAADCSVTAVSLNFGVYDPAATSADDSAGTVTVTCRHVSGNAERVSYSVSLSNGLYATSAATRAMRAGAASLGYNVFTDPARTQVWGNGSGATVIASGSMTVGPGVGNGTKTFVHTVYGRIPQLQDAAP
ncbi:MAG: Csu type fimbrial protein, partial [Steroidobacteraceae bacterium]